MGFFKDVRFAFRMMARAPAFTGVVVLALALGIGANTAVFTLVYAVLFRGLPFEDAHEIMHLENDNPDQGRDSISVSYPDYEDWRRLTASFEDLAAFTGQTVNLSDGEHVAERFRATVATPNIFKIIGQRPWRGRDFAEEDAVPGAPLVVILGHGIWRNRYGGSESVVGKVVRVNERPTTIIGVMPEGMKFPVNAAMWLPLRKEGRMDHRQNRSLEIFGRLRDGVTLEAAREEMSGIAANLARQYPESNKGFGAVVKAYNDEFNGGPIRLVFTVMMGAVGFVLLIVCANVANLQLARSARRAREISIRCALGAGRWRVVRQLLVESLLLGILGGLLGLLLAWGGVRLFENAVVNVGKPYWIVFKMDANIFLFLAGACVFTGILFGLAPALKASRTDIHDTLQQAGRSSMAGVGSRLFSAALVVLQLALAVVLLTGAGLLIRSLLNASAVDLGVPSTNLLTFRLALPEAKYGEPEKQIQFHDQLLERLNGLPGVEAAAFANDPPLGGSDHTALELEGSVLEPEERPNVRQMTVSPTYFTTVRAVLQRGRWFTRADGAEGHPVVIVSDRFVERFWPGEDPLGKRMRLGGEDGAWHTVVGVTAWIRQNSPNDPQVDPVLYVPYRQSPFRFLTTLVRSPLGSEELARAVRSEVAVLDADLPVYNLMTLQQYLYEDTWPYRVFGSVFSVFAVIALLLSAIGLYAVIAYSVSRRTHEIGVRMALGASSRGILYLVLSQGTRHLLAGLALGVAGAVGVSRVMESLLVQITPTDPVTFASVTTLLATVALSACFVPARRASRVDPIKALRVE